MLLELAAAATLREKAYRVVRGHIMRAWGDVGDFRQFKNVDKIFARVFDA